MACFADMSTKAGPPLHLDSLMGTIAYFSFPACGHVNPTLPIVRELVRRGERVVYFSTEPFRQVIESAGAGFHPYSARFPAPYEGPGPFAQLTNTLQFQLEASCAILAQLVDLTRALNPSLVMHDSFAPWGALLAQKLGRRSIASVPTILMSAEIDKRYGPDRSGRPEDPRLTLAWCAAFEARCRQAFEPFKLPVLPSPPQLLQSYGDLNLVYTSRQFQPLDEQFDRDRFAFVGPCFQGRSEVPHFPFECLDGRPLILISLGTVYGNQPEFYRACIEELADGPWQIVIATGPGIAAEDLGALPPNAMVRPKVPQIGILRRCSAFVTHGGMNSVQEALFHGVPLVIVPQAADQFWIAARAREVGCARLLDSSRGRKPRAIRSSLEELLSGDQRYKESAERIGTSLRSAGGYTRAADLVQGFVENRSGSAVRAADCAAENNSLSRLIQRPSSSTARPRSFPDARRFDHERRLPYLHPMGNQP